ncbi:MAG: fasciclin domain-containing protein [Bdellovibrionales bacterium]|nr:fasciclin domain-containing protein [Ramlibacter sp.]
MKLESCLAVSSVEDSSRKPFRCDANSGTLVAAVKAAGLVDTLKGLGPSSVFAPVIAAFTALPPGTVDTLLKPENNPALTKVLTWYVVSGKLGAFTNEKSPEVRAFFLCGQVMGCSAMPPTTRLKPPST